MAVKFRACRLFFLSRIGTITINNIDNESDLKIIHRLKVESMDVYFKYV